MFWAFNGMLVEGDERTYGTAPLAFRLLALDAELG